MRCGISVQLSQGEGTGTGDVPQLCIPCTDPASFHLQAPELLLLQTLKDCQAMTLAGMSWGHVWEQGTTWLCVPNPDIHSILEHPLSPSSEQGLMQTTQK